MEPKKKQKKPLGSGVWALIFIVACPPSGALRIPQ